MVMVRYIFLHRQTLALLQVVDGCLDQLGQVVRDMAVRGALFTE